MPNLNKVKLLILDPDIDVLCISETCLLPHTLNTLIDLPNYTVHRSDKRRGASVCVYAKQCLNAVMIDVKLQEHPAVENVFIRVQSRKLPPITIGCMYRHPKTDTDSFHYITEVLCNMCLQKRTAFILGDLNDNLLAPNSRLSRIIGNHKLWCNGSALGSQPKGPGFDPRVEWKS